MTTQHTPKEGAAQVPRPGFNIGGWPANALSVWLEFRELLADLKGEKIPVRHGDWRPGDQPCYVSDIRKAGRCLGWEPRTDKETGIRRLWEWVSSHKSLFATLANGQPPIDHRAKETV
jgi:UDP-glucose 4-epimerase